MTTLSGLDTFWDSSKTEGEASAGWFYKVLDVWKELPGGAEQVPELTISSGSITPSAADASRGAAFTIDTESDASTDDLANIVVTNTPVGRRLLLRAENDARSVIIKHLSGGSGQISISTEGDLTLDNTNKWVELILVGTTWYEVSRGGFDSISEGVSGLIISNNGTDSEHDIDISTGKASDSTGASILNLSSSLIKQIDATWAAGTNAGGLFSGTVAADTWYAVFIIQNDSTGVIDAGFDTSDTAANIPTGYTKYRRIGWVLTDSSSNIIGFTAYEVAGGSVDYDYSDIFIDLDTTTGTTRTLLTVTAPKNTFGKLTVTCLYQASTTNILVNSTNVADTAPSSNNADLVVETDNQRESIFKPIFVDGSNQVAYRANAVSTLRIYSRGFIDRRVD